jgi:hypothetical protein
LPHNQPSYFDDEKGYDLSDWGSTVKVAETSAGRYRVKIELTPPTSTGLPAWSVDEIEIVDASVDVAAEVDKLLEFGHQARLQDAKVRKPQFSRRTSNGSATTH